MTVVLPPLEQRPSPNRSGRGGAVPFLVVVHRPVGSYAGAIATCLSSSAQVSYHVLTDSSREATQFVPWDEKAWSCVTFNRVSYNVAIDDDAWTGADDAGLAAAARIVAFLCKRTGIPAIWSRKPTVDPGVCRHLDLGRAGGGHSDPTTSLDVWLTFMGLVAEEFRRGGFRPTWGVGELKRIEP